MRHRDASARADQGIPGTWGASRHCEMTSRKSLEGLVFEVKAGGSRSGALSRPAIFRHIHVFIMYESIHVINKAFPAVSPGCCCGFAVVVVTRTGHVVGQLVRWG